MSFLLTLLLLFNSHATTVSTKTPGFFEADNKNIQYVGRIDFSDPKKPKFWAPGVYIKAKFKGPTCEVIINDEVLWGNSHNYLEIVIDDKIFSRIQTKEKINTIKVAESLSRGEHTITICKNTEAGIGYLEFVGFRCAELVAPAPLPTRKIEFVGNSITCGTGMDQSEIACDKRQWYDQHNAYMSYGPTTARELNAQWHLTSVSGIGLIHSCCNMITTMPQVFDKVSLSDNKIPYDFKLYQPDVVTFCLGQNDGLQDSAKFCSTYVEFIGKVRTYYPNAHIVCITSPMADATLREGLKKYLTSVVDHVTKSGDRKVHTFFFSTSWNHGCGGHPDLNDHKLIAKELSDYLKKTMAW